MPEIHKTALGAEDSVDWRYFKTATEAVAELHSMQYEVCSVEQCEGSTMLESYTPDTNKYKGFAVVMGNEVKGVHQEVVDQSDCCLEIPQFGTKHSLNVSGNHRVSATVLTRCRYGSVSDGNRRRVPSNIKRPKTNRP